MKTLPDAIIAGMDGDSDRIILVRIIPESGDTWAELCWATKGITITDWEGGGASKSFAGGVLAKGKLGTIRQSVDIEQGGNVATVSGLTLRILNPEYNGTDRFDQSFTSDLENRRVEIRRVFWTGSSPAWSDTLLLYKGVVEDVEYDHAIYKIKVRDAGFKRHKDIPDLILNEDIYDEIPEYNKGKIAPLIYGNLSGGWLYLSNNNAVPLIRHNKNKGKFIIARNKIDALGSPSVMLYFKDVNRWALLSPSSGSFTVSEARPSILEFPLGVNMEAELYSQLEEQGEQTDPTSLDYKNAVDTDADSYFTLGASEKLFLRVPIPADFARIQSDGDLKLRITPGTITGTGIITYYNPEYDAGVGGFATGQVVNSSHSDIPQTFLFGNDNSAHGKEDDQSDASDRWTWDEIAFYEFGIEMDAGSSAQIKNIYIEIENLIVVSVGTIVINKRFGVGVRRRGLRKMAVFDRIESADNLSVNASGADFGAWIDADDRGNAEANDNGRYEGALVENAAYIIETILRDELGLGSSGIDWESFDTLGNTTDGERKDWKLATIIGVQDNSLNMIADFCQQAGLVFFQNYENKEKVITLKKQTAVKTIDRTTIRGDSIEVGFSELENVLNEFYLNYDKSWVTGNYRKTLYVTASSNNLSSNSRSGTPNTYTDLCSDSQSKYNTTKRLTMDCDWINDEATAELLIKWLAEWHCYRKRIFPFKTRGLEHVNLEMGDQVNIDHTLLPAGVSDDASFVIFDIKDDLDKDRMKFECMQMPDLLP